MDAIVEALRQQSVGCATAGSAIYADLLERAADAIARGGPLREWVTEFDGHPVLDALAMRMMGAVHRRVLGGRAPELAAHYPSAGGRYEPEGAWQAFEALVASDVAGLRAELVPVQTNEVMRCCALLGGFLRAAAQFELPLRLLEVGSSAGLLLGFDHYHYDLGEHGRYAPPGSLDAAPVLHCDWRGGPPDLAAPLRVASRRGCDPNPVDVRRPEKRLLLEGFMWADQVERLERLRAAIALALAHPPTVDTAPASRWLPQQLAEPTPGETTVVFHSVIWWYLSTDERRRVIDTLEQAGRRATPEQPLCWLRLEGSDLAHAEVRMRSWPDGEDVLLATSHWHGAWVAWGEAEPG